MREKMQKLAQTYQELFKRDPETILEIGSRDGHDVDILRQFCNVSIIDVWIIEPNSVCVKNIKQTYPYVNLIPCAVALTNGIAEFNAVVSKDDMYIGQSSLLHRTSMHSNTGVNWINGDNWVEVNTLTGKKVLQLIEKPIDLMKVDVEGYAFEVLESFEETLTSVKLIQVECEYEPFWENQKLYKDVSAYMLTKGFTEIYKLDYPGQCDVVWGRGYENNFHDSL